MSHHLSYPRHHPHHHPAAHENDEEERPGVSVIMPAMNEGNGIEEIVARVQSTMNGIMRSYEIIVVDDGSSDNTSAAAQRAGARVIRHPYNIGNGAAIKTGIRNAQGKELVMLDADGQHPPEDIPLLLDGLKEYDMVVGARSNESDTHLHRDVANTVYNWFAGYVCNRKIEDLTSGFRAVRAQVAQEFVTLLPNTFSYPTTMTMATLRSGYSLKYVPIVTSRRLENTRSKVRLLRDGVRFLLIIFKITTLFSPMKIFLPISFATFQIGFLYGLYKVFVLDGRYGPTSAILMTLAAVMFLIGLVSEQVTQLKFERGGNSWINRNS